LWYYKLGEIEKSDATFDFVWNELPPDMEPDNILNCCCILLYPIVRLRSFGGGMKKMCDMFDEQVIQNFHKYKIKFTPWRILFKPLPMLLDNMWHDPDKFQTSPKPL
jgi:hypothetical protein